MKKGYFLIINIYIMIFIHYKQETIKIQVCSRFPLLYILVGFLYIKLQNIYLLRKDLEEYILPHFFLLNNTANILNL